MTDLYALHPHIQADLFYRNTCVDFHSSENLYVLIKSEKKTFEVRVQHLKQHLYHKIFLKYLNVQCL